MLDRVKSEANASLHISQAQAKPTLSCGLTSPQPSGYHYYSSKAVVLQIKACEIVSELHKINVQHSINRLEKNRKYRNKCISSKLKTESSAFCS